MAENYAKVRMIQFWIICIDTLQPITIQKGGGCNGYLSVNRSQIRECNIYLSSDFPKMERIPSFKMIQSGLSIFGHPPRYKFVPAMGHLVVRTRYKKVTFIYLRLKRR